MQQARLLSTRMQYHGISYIRAFLRAPIASVLFVPALFSATTVHAGVTPFVDYYTTNLTANKTTDNNAALALLSSYSLIWTNGATWDTGPPPQAGATHFPQNNHNTAGG
jgi:hypothetical protein